MGFSALAFGCVYRATGWSAAPGVSPIPLARQRDVINHWTDAFNILDLIPGPEFLLLFMAFTLVVGVAAVLLRNLLPQAMSPGSMLDGPGRLPISLKPDYLDIAYLRGGRTAMLEAVLCNLYRTRRLSRYLRIHPTPARSEQRLTPLESAVLQAAGEDGLNRSSLIMDTGVVTELNRAARHSQDKLLALGIQPTATTQVVLLGATFAALVAVDGIAIIRLIRSWLRGYHNVGFLLILAVVASVVLWKLVPTVWVAGPGYRYLRRLQAEARSVIRRCQAHTLPYTAPEALYAAAACGALAMVGTPYAEISRQLQPPKTESGSWFSCSSCGGGSCGGGSCGGGGCGGGGCGGG